MGLFLILIASRFSNDMRKSCCTPEALGLWVERNGEYDPYRPVSWRSGEPGKLRGNEGTGERRSGGMDIRNQRIEGAYDNSLDACIAGDGMFGRGNFSIQ